LRILRIMARKTKLSPEIQEQICKHISIGVPFKYAALACGISERTLYNWLERGEKEKRGKYFQFLQAVKEAEARSIVRDIAILEKAAQEGKWQAVAWRLERRHPQDFGRKDEFRLEHSGKIDISVLKKYLLQKDEGETHNDNG